MFEFVLLGLVVVYNSYSLGRQKVIVQIYFSESDEVSQLRQRL